MSNSEQERLDFVSEDRPVKLSSRRRPLGDPHMHESIARLKGVSLPVEPPIAQPPVRLLLGKHELL